MNIFNKIFGKQELTEEDYATQDESYLIGEDY